MARIMMSMSGEGRGHATRIRSLVEQMRDRHEIRLYAPGDAYEFLLVEYGNDPEISLTEIPGLKFHYKNRRLRLFKTIGEGFRFKFRKLPRLVDFLVKEIEQHQPDIILTDFEPGLPRAAEKLQRSYISMTHQHFLLAYDFSSLSRKLKFFAWFIGLAVPLHYKRQSVTIISSFFKSELRPAWKGKAIAVGPMIRPEVRTGAIRTGILPKSSEEPRELIPPAPPFLLSYLRKQTSDDVVKVLAESPMPIKIYGIGERDPVGPLTFHNIDPHTFVEDLLTCQGVVSAAGNQLLGECMYLGKPVLAMPEEWHHEQLINAHFLQQMDCGMAVTLETFQERDLEKFLKHLEEYRTQIHSTCLGIDGTFDVIEILEDIAESRNAAQELMNQ